jgi:hypothetical protein
MGFNRFHDLCLHRLHVEAGAFLHRRELDEAFASLWFALSSTYYLVLIRK